VYVNQTEKSHVNISGRHNYVRFEVNQYGLGATGQTTVAGGSVATISVAAGGSEFLNGDPNVEIEGLGTGATATASIDANSVSDITLVSSGQGYVQPPNVKINMGSITSIKYR
jgi:hypothetical protein